MVSVHNPDQYMWNLRQVISQSRKRIGFLIGAGAPSGVRLIGTDPLIPAIAGLTRDVLSQLEEKFAPPIAAVIRDIRTDNPNIEEILTRIRAISAVLGDLTMHNMNGEQYGDLGKLICKHIGSIVGKDLPVGQNAYTELVSWISGTDRRTAIEVFTTNYDLLFEQAFERTRQPYFDGFVGGSRPFFDPSSVANNDPPPRWARLWKLHGSLGWEQGDAGDVTRIAKSDSPYCIFPEHLKYEQSRKAPFSALFDRFRSFLMEPDTLLIACGFSFSDYHITAIIDECLVANPAASVFAFQFRNLDDEPNAKALGLQRSNVSVYARDKAVVNAIQAPWRTGEPPTRNWYPIQETFWKRPTADEPGQFLLGDFGKFAPFFSTARSEQEAPQVPLKSEAAPIGEAASAEPAQP